MGNSEYLVPTPAPKKGFRTFAFSLLASGLSSSADEIRAHRGLSVVKKSSYFTLFGLLGLSVGALSSTAFAEDLSGNGTAVQTSNYSIDLYQTAVYTGSRVTGLSGAYVSIAEGNDGSLQNPAAPAIRPGYSVDHFDYWIGFGLTAPAAVSDMDFFNTGQGNTNISGSGAGLSSYVFITPSLNLQFGTVGVGATFEMQNYSLVSSADKDSTSPPSVNTSFMITHLQAAKMLNRGEWVIGAGARIASIAVDSVTGTSQSQTQMSGASAGLELGFVYAPLWRQFRIGGTFRSPVTASVTDDDNLPPDANGNYVIQGSSGPIYLPKQATLPWDVNVGVSYQFGERAYNIPWTEYSADLDQVLANIEAKKAKRHLDTKARRAEIERFSSDPETDKRLLDEEEAALDAADDRAYDTAVNERWRWRRAGYRRMTRNYLLVSFSTVIGGLANQAIGIESFVNQVVNRSGEWIVVSPRFGLETEPIRNYVKIRGGTYIEPTRFETSTPRVHATAGFDVRLGNFDVFGLWPQDYVWKLGAMADISRDYLIFGGSVGGWY